MLGRQEIKDVLANIVRRPPMSALRVSEADEKYVRRRGSPRGRRPI